MKNINVKNILPYNLNWKGVSITKRAENHIHNLMIPDSKIKGLRIDIKKSGCAGFTYVIKLTKNPLNDDLKFLYNKILLFVSIKAIKFIDGTEIDYIKEGLNQKFVFKNPKAQHICGCGMSFSSE